MQTVRTQSLKDGIYSVEVAFSSYGRPNLTPQEEKAILENYGVTIDLSAITFNGKYGLQGKDVVKVDFSTAGDTVTLNLNKLVYPLDETFKASYSVKASTIATVGTVLNTKELMADAMCTLFAEKIEQAIQTAIDDAVLKTNSFEQTETKTL